MSERAMMDPSRSSGAETSGEGSHREDGQTTIVMALFMATFLLGFVALGIDTEALFHAKRQAQAAADAAAVAYAEEYDAYGATNAYAAATAAAKLNGFDTTAATNPAVVTVNNPPLYGNYKTAAANAYFEVLVQAPVPTFFAKVVTGKSSVTVTGRAVAGAGLTSPSCICLEGTTGNDLNVYGSAVFNPTNCGTTVDSSSDNAVTVSGSALLGGTSIGSVSTDWYPSQVTGSAVISPGTKIIQGISTRCSPPLPAPPVYNASLCTASPAGHYGGSASYSIGPGSAYSTTQSGNLVCYTSISPTGSQNVNINPGIYVINGGSATFTGNTVSTSGGSGVFFYLVNGASLTITGNVGINLTAMTSGPYAGVAIYQDPSDTQGMNISGDTNVSINGAIYAPGAVVTLTGNSETIDSDMVAKSMILGGNTNLNSVPAANYGTLNITTAKLGE